MVICLSHGGSTLYLSEEPVNQVAVGTVDGVVIVHRENGNNWNVSQTTLQGCHVHALLTIPDTDQIFAGIHKGSIFVSDNAGKSWHTRDKGLAEKDIYCLNYCRQANKIKLYAGTEPAHLFESDNLGTSWHEIESMRSVPSVAKWTFPAPPHVAHVKNIAFDPQLPAVLYVCIEQGGLLKSDDGGEKWQELHGFDDRVDFELPPGAFLDDIHRILVHPAESDWLFLSGGFGLCTSRDGGKTWGHLTTPAMRIGYPDPLLLDPTSPNILLQAGAENNPHFWRSTNAARAAIARSKDNGESWELLNHGIPENIRGNFEAMCMVVGDNSSSIFVGSTDGDVYCSEDKGDHWRIIASGLPAISKGRHYQLLR